MFRRSSSHYWHGTLSRNRLATRGRAHVSASSMYWAMSSIMESYILYNEHKPWKLQDGVSKYSQRSVQVSMSFTTRKRANESPLPAHLSCDANASGAGARSPE